MTRTFGLALVALLAGCSDSRPNLLLVTVDTLRADRLECYDGPSNCAYPEPPPSPPMKREFLLVDEQAGCIPPSPCAANLTGMRPSTSLELRIMSVNTLGSSVPNAEPVGTITPAAQPQMSGPPQVTNYAQLSITLVWSHAVDNGNPLQSYVARAEDVQSGEEFLTDPPLDPSLTKACEAGKAYDVQSGPAYAPLQQIVKQIVRSIGGS